MKKVLILYRSKSGYTKKYALWAAKALNGEARKLDDVMHSSLPDTIPLSMAAGFTPGG